MDNSDLIGPTSFDEQQQVENLVRAKEGVVITQDPLTLDIPDDEIIKIIDNRIDTAKKFFDDKYNLTERRKKNEMYLFGRQIDEKEKNQEFKKYESRANDNVLYEIETSLKPLAMSHLPDMMVLPGTEEESKQETARSLSKAIDDTNKKRKQRKTLAICFKHLPTYFTGVMKVRWDPSLGDQGDFRFDPVHPSLVVVSQTAKTNDTDDIDMIAECTPCSVQELFMRFPSKKDDLKGELIKDGVKLNDKDNWKDLATEVKVWEIHFTWFKKKDSKEVLAEPVEDVFEPGVKWEKIESIIWKYGKVILDKMLTPNYDYEGEDAFFVQDNPQDESTKRELTPEEMMQRLITGDVSGIQKEKVYHNYFKAPKKPYYFFGYDQWGKVVYDETSRIEQNIRNQENLDDQLKRIIDQLKQRIKHIWSKESGLKAEDVQKMDMDNPNLDALIEGDIAKVHGVVLPERPDAPQYKSLQDTRDRMYAISHATAVRGAIQSDVATTNQIAREADFTTTDDLVEDTINAASEWMANWQMQFIKLRYTEDHLKQLIGKEGHVTFVKLRRDMISDGMEVTIKSSSTDKLKAQNNALQMAKLGAPFTNPIDFYRDMGLDDPEGRTERGMTFALQPNVYFTKFVMKLKDSQAMGDMLNGAVPNPAVPATVPPAQPSATPLPANPNAGNTANVPAVPPPMPTATPTVNNV
jgi:hypothetical protein